MKKIALLSAVLAVLPLESPFANLLKNGDFETGPKDKETYTFKESPGWYNRAKQGTNQAVNARTTEGSLEGSTYSATVNDRGDEISSFVQRTEHSISDGEVFEVSLDWTSAWQWQGEDVLRVVVFATDNNKLGGNIVWEDAVDFERAPKGAWEKKTHTFQPASSEATGKTLFFAFSGVDPQQAGVPGWVRVDNIVLTAKSQ